MPFATTPSAKPVWTQPGTRWRRRLLDWYLPRPRLPNNGSPSHCRLARDYVHPPAQLPFTSDVEAQTWLDFQHENLMLGVRIADASGMDNMVCQLVHAMWPWWRSHHNYLLWEEAHAIACRAVTRCHALEPERALLNTWGVGLRSSGRRRARSTRASPDPLRTGLHSVRDGPS
ncbi:hypothetical protein GCM10009578_031840 [Streptomyces rhizosphaericus]